MERLQTIPGVSTVQIWGQKRYAMRIWMDPGKMASYGVTAADIVTALDRENVELPGGKIEGNRTELSVKPLGGLRTKSHLIILFLEQAEIIL